MVRKKNKHNENKNIYLVGGIISMAVVFMLVSVVMVTSKVASGSSAQMLKERLAKQEQKLKKQQAKEARLVQIKACGDAGKC